MGASPEPYLEATLASIASTVDLLVVNDNSGAEEGENAAVIGASALAKAGRVRTFRHTFRGFDAMRNDAFADLRGLASPDWVLFLDADEVHGEQLAPIARNVLPALPASVGRLDAYTYHFWGTFGWISDVARRLCFFRFSPDLRWENAVHENLTGLSGSAVVIPYVYHHYGNVLPPPLLAAKHRRYFEYGNPVPEPPLPEAATIDVYVERAAHVRPFHGSHPAAAQPIVERIAAESASVFEAIDRGIRRRRTPAIRVAGGAAGANEYLRVALRAIEHPGLYRGPRVAR